MEKFDDKIKMMDAGTALFTGKDGFGSAIGSVRAEMEVYGKVLRPADFREDGLPSSLQGCDLLLDRSTLWRKRHVSCKVEDAGDTGLRTPDGETVRRYAAVFMEGNRSTFLRGAVHALVCAALLAGLLLPGRLPGPEQAPSAVFGVIRIIAGILLLLAVLYHWILPDRDAAGIVDQIQQALRSRSAS